MNENISNYRVDVQGHRGCRGLMPENTIEGFKKALDIGVTTLEMDVVISKDLKVIVSHEPFFSHEIAKDSLGNDIDKNNEKNHNIYQLNYDEIQKYDVGTRHHERFPEQKKLTCYKPSLEDVFTEIEKYCKMNHIKAPFYNIEIKRVPFEDDSFHPVLEIFVKLVVETVQNSGFQERINIQSFDFASLRETKKIAPDIRLALLIEHPSDAENNIKSLGFTPEIYSPYFPLVDATLMEYAKSINMQVIPWTINEVSDMEKMLKFKVDGIITDYPDKLQEVLKKKDIQMKNY